MKYHTLVLLLLLSNIGITQVKVRGIVLDSSTKEPLIGVHVISLNDVSTGTTSEVDGTFSLTLDSSSEEVQLLFSYIGYVELAVSTSVDQNITVHMTTSAIEIGHVEIKATKSIGEEFAVTQISKLDIYTNPVARADPIRALQILPYSTNVDETAAVSLRGSPPSETGYIFNNVPIDDAFKLDQSNNIGQFSIFNTSMINRVDIFPSNPPLEFNSSSSGIISLYTDGLASDDERSINITLAGMGLKWTEKLNANSSFSSYANWSREEGLTALNKKALDDLKGFQSFDMGHYFVSQFSNGGLLKVFNYSLIEDYQYEYPSPSYTGISFQNKKRNQTVINYERRLSKKTSMSINQGINFSSAGYQYGNLDHNIKRNDFYTGVDFRFHSQFYSLKTGMAVDAHLINNHGQYAQYYWALNASHPVEKYTNKESFFNPEIYSYHKFRISDHFIFGFADRRNLVPSNGIEKYNSNQANLSINLGSHQFKLSLGEYHKVNYPGEQFYETTLVKSTHYSLDYSTTYRDLDLNIGLYAKRSSIAEQEFEIKGIELFATYQKGAINTSLSIAHIRSERLSEEERTPTDHDLDYFLRHIFKYKFNGLVELNSVFVLRPGRYYSPIIGSEFHSLTETYIPIYQNQKERLPYYSTWSLSLSKIIGFDDSSLIAFVSASNILNRRNVSEPIYDQEYHRIGDYYFGRRVFFFGGVYNW